MNKILSGLRRHMAVLQPRIKDVTQDAKLNSINVTESRKKQGNLEIGSNWCHEAERGRGATRVQIPSIKDRT